jgi:fibronectin type 3 domain-containing protein
MKRLTTAGVVFFCMTLGFGQGLQGNVIISGKAIINVTGHSVTLTWSASQGATSYNVYRATVSGGSYAQIATGIVNATYSDVHVTNSQTLYYVTTAVSSGYESGFSNQAVAVIP